MDRWSLSKQGAPGAAAVLGAALLLAPASLRAETLGLSLRPGAETSPQFVAESATAERPGSIARLGELSAEFRQQATYLAVTLIAGHGWSFQSTPPPVTVPPPDLGNAQDPPPAPPGPPPPPPPPSPPPGGGDGGGSTPPPPVTDPPPGGQGDPPPNATPEPASLTIAGVGVALVVLAGRRRRRRATWAGSAVRES